VVAQLAARLDVPVFTQDERLSSREAEQRLSVREKDWRKRKAKLDAASAAVILQDYLDSQAMSGKREERRGKAIREEAE
jgi:putative transcription antitermination factor YqgF